MTDQLPDFRNPDAWHPPAQMLKLSELATGLDVVVEVGSWLGHSALALVRGVAGKVYCIDHWRGSDNGTGRVIDPLALYEAFLDNIHRLRVSDRIVPIMSPSFDASLLFLLKPIDLVYIDGDHEKKAVLDDLERWAPLVKLGGIVCGDDYGERGPHDAFNEYFRKADNVESFGTECGGRLVVVRLKG